MLLQHPVQAIKGDIFEIRWSRGNTAVYSKICVLYVCAELNNCFMPHKYSGTLVFLTILLVNVYNVLAEEHFYLSATLVKILLKTKKDINKKI